MRVSSLALSPNSIDAEVVTSLFLYGTTSAPDSLYERVKTQGYLDSLKVNNVAGIPTKVV